MSPTVQEGGTVPIVGRAFQFRDRVAIIDGFGNHRFEELIQSSRKIAGGLLDGRDDLNEARVCFLVPQNFEYPVVQWGIWRAGGVAVPISPIHSLSEDKYIIDDSDAEVVIYDPQFESLLSPLLIREDERKFVSTESLLNSFSQPLPRVAEERRAMILYTSGTTSGPKGAVITHRNIRSQITSLTRAWEWSEDDYILNVLPLHHVHGIVNVLCCALWAGAKCEMLPKFDASTVWEKFVEEDLTLFMAVPTIYLSLISFFDGASETEKSEMKRSCQKFRLMVSGSAALPISVQEKWRIISGQMLLERYGMTEVGMALSNPLHGQRRPGFVGVPLPNVEVKLVGDDRRPVDPNSKEPGEIYVKGQTVFLEYWRRSEITQESFVGEWFKTGDIGIREDGYYRILGRKSIDIIKTGGYKVSALEIEEVLREHPAVKECAVVGVQDDYWGERVCAALVLYAGKHLTLDELKEWASDKVAKYKIPKQIIVLETLPRNAMGKVTKPDVKTLFAS
jgi:malonyl-CoA/methylmalonyl-CoA synthetase